MFREPTPQDFSESKYSDLLEDWLFEDSKEPLTIRINNPDRARFAVLGLFNSIDPSDRYVMRVDFKDKKYQNRNFHTTISQGNIDQIKSAFQTVIRDEDPTGSDESVELILQHPSKLTITELAKSVKPRLSGSFFPYLSTSNYDLEHAQIIHKKHADNIEKSKLLRTPCFIHALMMAGLPRHLIGSLKTSIIGAHFPRRKINEIATRLGFRVSLKHLKPSGRTETRVFGESKTSEIYHLGLIQGHYFVNRVEKITRYAFENNFEQDRWQEVKDARYARSEFKTFDCVRLLIKAGYIEKYKNSRLLQSLGVIKKDFSDLKYPDECARLIKPRKKQDLSKYKICVADIETTTDGRHVPFLMAWQYEGGPMQRATGPNCFKSMLNKLQDKTILYFHNLKYDGRFLIKFIGRTYINIIEAGNSIIGLDFKNSNKAFIKVRCSYRITGAPLKKFASMFELDVKKEIVPYNIFRSEFIARRTVHTSECLINAKPITPEDLKQMHDNCKHWGVKTRLDDKKDPTKGFKFVHNKYIMKYCEYDVATTLAGIRKHRQAIKEAFNMDIIAYLTIPSMAYSYFLREGAFNGVYELSGVPREFCQRATLGGRCMLSNNIPAMTESGIVDIDNNSLYAAAGAFDPADIKKNPGGFYNKRPGGFPIGRPKPIPEEKLNLEWLYKCSHFVIYAHISNLKPLKFPLTSDMTDEGVRDWNNKDKYAYINTQQAEDIEHFQNGTIKPIKGYYWNEGVNKKVIEIFETLYADRMKYKKAGNKPASNSRKLMLNSSYGRMIMKPITSNTIILNTREEFQKALSAKFEYVKSAFQLPGCEKYVLRIREPLDKSYNAVHCGNIILANSKRIMSELMVTAEDVGAGSFYTDTDSFMFPKSDFKRVELAYETIYKKPLMGSWMGQFSSDYEIHGCKNVVALKAIFGGKKTYIQLLEGEDIKTGKKRRKYLCRMKGIPQSTLKYTADKNHDGDEWKLYKHLADGNTVKFDLTNGGTAPNFRAMPNMTWESINDFTRTAKFDPFPKKSQATI